MQKHLPAYGLVVNIFADTAEEVWGLYRDILNIIDKNDQEALAKSRMPGAPPQAAHASTPPAVHAAASQPPSPAPKAQGAPPNFTTPPACEECGATEFMELIAWYDKKDRKQRKAWKCQACGIWAR
jgi:hypothetical protein